ncbi:MAG: 4-hydroxythreonine-4-phosphate dehydrogenase PdxA [Pseudomonadota bacterium]
MIDPNAPLAVTMGDPAGCGPAITEAAWAQRLGSGLSSFFVIADPCVFSAQCPIELIDAPQDAISVFSEALPVLPLRLDDRDALVPGTPDQAFASAIIESIRRASDLCLNGQASGVVTNPISKAVLYDAGFRFAGHTEFIADLCSDSDETLLPVMMLVGGGLRVALATIHVPLMQVTEHLSAAGLRQVAEITHAALKRDFGIAAPRIAFTGLNPHAGEDGKIGTEERELINPTAEALRSTGIEISNARPGDTVFHEALSGTYDAVIAMTHDQGLIPVKTLDMWGGVNTTLGLPIVRTSPDHGTAYDAAAAGSCRPDSLIAALKLAASIVAQRAQADG